MQSQELLTGLEAIVASVITMHPEYHALLSAPEQFIDGDYFPQFGHINPFLHMGMHISLAEQRQSNRPQGIELIYQQFLKKHGDAHAAEHEMLSCLAESLWQAQRDNKLPNEKNYLRLLRQSLAG